MGNPGSALVRATSFARCDHCAEFYKPTSASRGGGGACLGGSGPGGVGVCLVQGGWCAWSGGGVSAPAGCVPGPGGWVWSQGRCLVWGGLVLRGGVPGSEGGVPGLGVCLVRRGSGSGGGAPGPEGVCLVWGVPGLGGVWSWGVWHPSMH